MHLLEQYALNTGLKIGKPYVYKKFFPLPFDEDYISFQPYTKGSAKNYKYWQDVIDIIFPVLKREKTRIVQLGLPDEAHVNGCYDLRGKTGLNQMLYVISRGIMHLGGDSCGAHFASGENKKIVSLYSIMSHKNCGPYWSNKPDVSCMEPRRKKGEKWSYNYESDPEVINRLKPEDIAKEVFAKLGEHNPYPFKTLYTGEKYQERKIQLIPYDYIGNVEDLNVETLIVRMDLNFNEKVLEEQLQRSQCSIITNKEIDVSILKKYRQKIPELVFLIDQKTDPTYFQKLVKNGCRFELMTTLAEKELNKIKLNYLDYGLIQKFPSSSRADVDKLIKHKNLENIYFKSSVLYVMDGSFYGFPLRSLSNPELPNMDSNTPRQIADHPLFWGGLSHMTLLEKH
jgi:hypothetical protein